MTHKAGAEHAIVETVLAIEHASTPEDLPGDLCCGCEPDLAVCCYKALGAAGQTQQDCCWKIGQTGTFTFTQNAVVFSYCCSSGPPNNDELCQTPTCVTSTWSARTTVWEMVLISCFHGLLWVPNGEGPKPQCGYPVGFNSSGFFNLAAACGACLPCGPIDDCFRSHGHECTCFGVIQAGCCGGVQANPGDHCEPTIEESFSSCTSWDVFCDISSDTCSGVCENIGCQAHQDNVHAHFHVPPTTCTFCMESILGFEQCLENEIFDDFCMDPLVEGACCEDEGNLPDCQDVSAPTCAHTGGQWHSGIDCANYDCAAPPPLLGLGACCADQGNSPACSYVGLVACNQLGGTWHQNTTCATYNCTTPPPPPPPPDVSPFPRRQPVNP